MFFTLSKFVLGAIFITAASLCVNAQIDASTSRGLPNREDLPKNILETLAKERIEQEKEEHEKLLKTGEEALRISQDLEKSFADQNNLSPDDLKKLERLEKLVKKIRKELGGDNDDFDKNFAEKGETEKSLNSMQSAFSALQQNTVKLFDELKKSNRHTISVAAIQSSNLLLKAVRFLRIVR